MRGPLRNELMKCFGQELHLRCPQFNLFETEKDTKTWSWKISQNLVVFITVQAFDRKDQFVVEIAWNESEEYPWGAFGTLKTDQTQGRGRLSQLWESGPDAAVWDAAPEETVRASQRLDALRAGKDPGLPGAPPPIAQTLPRILPLVSDALDKFEKYGMSLFRRVAEARGVEVAR